MVTFLFLLFLSHLSSLEASQNKSEVEVLLICGGGSAVGPLAIADCEVLGAPGDGCSVPDLPIPLAEPNTVLTADGLILNCAGWHNGPTVNKNCYYLDLEAGTWSYHSTSNFGGLWRAETVSMPSGVYRVPSDNSEVVEFLPTGSTEWELLPGNMPPGGWVGMSCSVPISDFQFVVIGGVPSKFLQVIEFDTRTSSWNRWPGLGSLCSHDRLEHSCARLGDNIVISGGSGNEFSGSCDNEEKTTTILNIPLKRVVFEGGNMNVARNDFGMAAVNGKILAFAGFGGWNENGGIILDSIEEKEDVVFGDWTLLPQKLVTPRYVFGWVSAPRALVCGSK